MTKIFVVGSYVQGLTIRVPRMPVMGESLVGDSFDMGPGGKGSNQAIAAARLGADVRLLAGIGDDVFGQLALETWRTESIATDRIQIMPGCHSGVGFVNVTPDGENWISVDMGANMLLRPRHVLDRARDIADCDILMTQFEIPSDTAALALAVGRDQGALTILNPAPARPADAAMLSQVDILTPNAIEARVLLGLPPDAEVPDELLAYELRAFGVDSVVITQGARGALVVDHHGPTQIPAPSINAVDVTGAGDSFNAALAVGLGATLNMEEWEWDLRAAVRLAVRAGAYTARHLGVIAGLPTRAQLDDFA